MRRMTVVLAALVLLGAPARAANELVATEIMYNSVESPDVEWIEVYNNSGGTLDLTGWYVLDSNDSHTKVYLAGALAPGETRVLAGTESLFTAKYPGVTNIFAAYFQTYAGAGWDLGNSGDTVRLYDALGALVFSVTFTDAAPWPTAADGGGPSLRLTSLSCGNLADATCWAAGPVDGSPGTVETTVPILNESWGSLKATYR
jgi:hypothetical protein